MRDTVSLEIKTPKKTELNLGNTKIVGGEGENGATFYPDVSPEGIISWTNDKELPNPTPVNIRGKDGIDGEDGQSVYVSKITQNIVDGEYSSVEFSDGTSLKIKNGNTGSAGEQGEDGLDGFSPTIDISKQGRITTLKITDKNGTRTTNINDGLDGENGKNGTDGKDGISTYHEWDGTTLRITSASGTSSADLRGERGLQGIQGIQGEKGDPFFISKVYTSVVDMNNGYATDEVKIGQFVVIETGDVNDEDNAKLFIKGNYSYEFLTDLSGAQGMRGPAGIQGEQGIQGERGETGIGISSIVKSHTQGLVDTYTINYTDGSNTNFTVTNGINGKDGEKGANGTSVTVSSVSESSADGGSNVVTFSDGKTLTVKNGSRGSTGEKGADGVSATHSWNGTTLTITSASGSSSANLKGAKGDKGDTGANGTNGKDGAKGADGYTPRREVDYWTPADQEFIVQQVISALGTPVFGRLDENNNIILTGELADGTYTFVYEDEDGVQTTIGTIEKGGITNWLPIATDANGAIYNSVGYKAGVRLSTTDGTTEKTADGFYLTGFIPVPLNAIVRFQGMNIGGTSYGDTFYCYDADKKYLGAPTARYLNDPDRLGEAVYEGGYLKQFTATSTIMRSSPAFAGGYIRFGAVSISSDAIITVNEEIV